MADLDITPDQAADKASALKAYKKRWAAEWRAANLEKAKEIDRQAYRKNREKVIARVLAQYHQNRDEYNARLAAWREKNRERIGAYAKQYRAANLPKKRIAEAARRARRAACGGRYTEGDIAVLTAVQKGRCAYCRVRLRGRFHVDHIMPLVLKGRNDRKNLQLLCPPCNLKKGRKHPLEFARRNGRLV